MSLLTQVGKNRRLAGWQGQVEGWDKVGEYGMKPLESASSPCFGAQSSHASAFNGDVLSGGTLGGI